MQINEGENSNNINIAWARQKITGFKEMMDKVQKSKEAEEARRKKIGYVPEVTA